MTWRMALATSPAASVFGPLLFSGRLYDGVQAAAELGYDGVEVSLRSVAEVDAGRLAEELASRGLALSALGSGRAFLEDGLSFCHPEPEVRRQAVARIGEHIALAARFGAVVIIGLVRGARPAEAEGRVAHTRIVECMRHCAAAAGEADVDLVVEAINRYETVFQNTAAQTLELLDEVGASGVGLLLDVFHMNIEEVSVADAVRQAGGRLGYFHIVDSNRWAPGCGHVDYAEIFSALREVAYEGWLSAEILPRPDDQTAARLARDFVSGAASYR